MQEETSETTDLVIYSDVEAFGQVADDYQARRSANTLRRQRDDLTLFCTYLAAAGAARSPDDLFCDLEAWRGISAGLVKDYCHKEGRNVDREREVSRVGAKKALPTALIAGVKLKPDPQQ